MRKWEWGQCDPIEWTVTQLSTLGRFRVSRKSVDKVAHYFPIRAVAGVL